MSKIEEARKILIEIGMPVQQQSDICCLTLLALTNIKKRTSWSEAENPWLRIHDIIQFSNTHYKASYAENSRETFRKQALHAFRSAAVIEGNMVATNSPNYRYRITDEALILIKAYKTRKWSNRLSLFLQKHESLKDKYSSKKEVSMIPVVINDKSLSLSYGKHNELQKRIIESFAPRFAPGSECLYIGDTTLKSLIKNERVLSEIGIEITLHDKMPDVVLYRRDKDWIYFVEAVTSVGPMSPKRIEELRILSRNSRSGIIFVTAFPDFKTYKKFSEELAWDTEIWIASMPDHMIHLNGDQFLGPR